MTTIQKLTPPLAPCHACGHEYAGAICPICKTEHPSFTALKNIAKKEQESGSIVQLAGEVC